MNPLYYNGIIFIGQDSHFNFAHMYIYVLVHTYNIYIYIFFFLLSTLSNIHNLPHPPMDLAPRN